MIAIYKLFKLVRDSYAHFVNSSLFDNTWARHPQICYCRLKKQSLWITYYII